MSLSDDTDRAIAEGRALVRDNQTGGRHRMADSIGQGSKSKKRKNWIKRAKYLAGAVLTILVTASVAGLVLDGIGFTGVMMTALAVMAASYVFTRYPKVKTPKRADLNKGDANEMVARTELWLEAQRPALPAPAVTLVDQLGVQLDSLGAQLQTIDPAHPSVNEVRELVGEYIPETIDNYRKIPEHLRGEQHAGKTADDRLTDSLTKISGEMDRVTRRLAEGALDDLAIKDRYLEYRYGGDEALEDLRK